LFLDGTMVIMLKAFLDTWPRRFAAELPNECWQAGLHPLAARRRAGTAISCWIDDHSRLALSATAHHRVTGPIVVGTFRTAVASHGRRARR